MFANIYSVPQMAVNVYRSTVLFSYLTVNMNDKCLDEANINAASKKYFET
jgi:hypothetical protein